MGGYRLSFYVYAVGSSSISGSSPSVAEKQTFKALSVRTVDNKGVLDRIASLRPAPG